VFLSRNARWRLTELRLGTAADMAVKGQGLIDKILNQLI
jgi:hypothetical protein